MKMGKIYFLQRADGLIKIGYTNDLEKRLSSLTKSHGLLTVLRVINGDRRREKATHTAFIRFNEYGEWFRPHVDLLAHIRDVEDGSQVAATKGEFEKEWVAGEQALADEAAAVLKRLLLTRKQRTGLSYIPAIKAVCTDYRLKRWTLQNLFEGKAGSVSAFTSKRLREALLEEFEAYRAELVADLESIEPGALGKA